MSLVVWTILITNILFAWGFHQQMNIKFQQKLDAIRRSIALHQIFKHWAKVPEKTDIFHLKNHQLFVKNRVGDIEIVRQLRNQKSFKVSRCLTGVEEMSVLVWNKSFGIEQRIWACHGQQLTLEKPLPSSFIPPFYAMLFYPIQLSVQGARLYLNYHENKQVWLSGFEYLKFSLDERLIIELKWPHLPRMRWTF